MTYVPQETEKKASKKRVLMDDDDTQVLLTEAVELLREIRDLLKFGD
jgi:hypothetical protein